MGQMGEGMGQQGGEGMGRMGANRYIGCCIWKCMHTAEADVEANDLGALAAVGCLPAISTILELVNMLPHLSSPTTHTLQNVCLKLN
ncbi:hypothetical protein Tco_1468604 [Tanacetum coccineum]